MSRFECLSFMVEDDQVNLAAPRSEWLITVPLVDVFKY